MRNEIPLDTHSRDEALLRAAELRALASYPYIVSVNEMGERGIHDNSMLVAAARRELGHRKIRRRYLSSEFSADHGWDILLNLFAHEHESHSIRLADAAERWELSPTTTVRFLAALIGTNMIMRTPDGRGRDTATYHLTDLGRLCVAQILSAYE